MRQEPRSQDGYRRSPARDGTKASSGAKVRAPRRGASGTPLDAAREGTGVAATAARPLRSSTRRRSGRKAASRGSNDERATACGAQQAQKEQITKFTPRFIRSEVGNSLRQG